MIKPALKSAQAFFCALLAFFISLEKKNHLKKVVLSIILAKLL